MSQGEPENMAVIGESVIEKWKPWLRSIGVDVDGQPITRVLVDINVDEIARVYIERYGDLRLEDPPPLGIESEVSDRV